MIIKNRVRYWLSVDIKADSPEQMQKVIKDLTRTLQFDTHIGEKRGINVEICDETFVIGFDKVLSTEIIN